MTADEPEFASYEVGAGLGQSRPFLRATLGDRGQDDETPADEPRELRVRDRLARLDAGLPPLPPGEYPDEVLMPPPRRPAAVNPVVATPALAKPAAEIVPPFAGAFDRGDVADEFVEETAAVEPESALKPEPDDEPAPVSAPPAAPGLFRPLVEEADVIEENGGDAPPVGDGEPEDGEAEEPAPAAAARRPIFRRFRG